MQPGTNCHGHPQKEAAVCRARWRMGRGVTASPRASWRWCRVAPVHTATGTAGAGTSLPDLRGTVFSWLNHDRQAGARQPVTVGGKQARPPGCRGFVSRQYKMPAVGRQETGLPVLEVGPSWKRQWVLCTALAGGGHRWGTGAYGSTSVATGLLCPRGGDSPSGLCLQQLCPGPGAMPRASSIAPHPASCPVSGLRAMPEPGPQHTAAVLVTPA